MSNPAAYGDRHAAVYDRLYGKRFAPDAAVDALAAAAGAGSVLELGVGTGRLAIPLTSRGVTVDGIEASQAMITQLRAQPGGGRVGVFAVDLTDFELERHDYAVAVCAVSTLFMLTHAEQRSCIAAVARHLRPGGQLFIEAFQPDPRRFDAAGRRVEHRPSPDGSGHVVRSLHDIPGRAIRITHEMTDVTGTASYDVTLHYRNVDELDSIAAAADLHLAARWHDWTGTPTREDSTDPISIYRLSPVTESD